MNYTLACNMCIIYFGMVSIAEQSFSILKKTKRQKN